MNRIILRTAVWMVIFIGLAGLNPPPGLSAPAASAGLSKGWTRTWGASGSEKVGRVALDGAGNLYAAGEFAGTLDFNPSPAAADFHSSNSGSIDAFLSKYDSAGNLLWAKTWGGSKRDVAYGVGVDGLGNAYVVGPYIDTVDFDPDPLLTDIHTSNAISGTFYHNNIFLSKFAPDGTFQWARTWGPGYVKGSVGGAEAYNVVVAGSALYVVGDFSGDVTDFNPWGSHDYHANHPASQGNLYFDSFLSKFDLDGNFQWARTWGGEGYDDGPGVAVDGFGSVYVAGMYGSQTINFDPAGGSGGLGHPAHDSGPIVDVFLSKFDASGNFQWVRTWGGQGTEDAMGTVVVDEANMVYVGGRYASTLCDFNPGGVPDLHSTNGGLDAFVSKWSPDGNFQWARTWGGSGTDSVVGLAVDGLGSVYTTGWYSGAVDFDPGGGLDNHTSNGLKDVFFNQFDANGNFYWAKTWGGSGDDMAGLAMLGRHSIYVAGGFGGAPAETVDFDPGSGVDNHSAAGAADAFVSQFLVQSHPVYLPLLTR